MPVVKGTLAFREVDVFAVANGYGGACQAGQFMEVAEKVGVFHESVDVAVAKGYSLRCYAGKPVVVPVIAALGKHRASKELVRVRLALIGSWFWSWPALVLVSAAFGTVQVEGFAAYIHILAPFFGNTQN
jgi:hypothetical protein